MLSDIEIAQATEPKHINDVAKISGIPEEYIEQYGKYKAKIDLKFLEKSKLIGFLRKQAKIQRVCQYHRPMPNTMAIKTSHRTR